MDYEENVVDTEETGMDGAATEEESFDTDGLSEEVEDSSESLDSFADEEEGEEQAEEPVKASQGTSEPGYVQRRIEKALAKERESIRAEIEARYAPIQERLIEMDAQDLVRKGVVKDIDTARELVRYRNGQTSAPAPKQETAEPPRNERGQYAPKEDPASSTRIDMLAHQADRIKEQTGIDVIAEFSRNEEVKGKIMRGEMDFYDLAETMKGQQGGRRKPPAPTRSSNGASGQNPNAIESMSKEQFARLEKKIAEGARFKLT